MRIVTFCATQDSGKTSTIRELVSRLRAEGKRCAVIVNESGKIDYDPAFIAENRLHIDRLRGGWVGCRLAGSLTNMIKAIKRDLNPDYLFIEPYELVVTKVMRTTLAMGKRDVDYEIGPVIAMADARDFDNNWRQRRQTIVNHLTGSEAVLISRADAVDEGQLDKILELIGQAVSPSILFPLSLFEKRGIGKLMKVVTG